MQPEQTRVLLKEAGDAADPRSGALYCYADLQELLGKLAIAAETLLAENERLTGRLRRSVSSDMSVSGSSNECEKVPVATP